MGHQAGWTVSVPLLCDERSSLIVWHKEYGAYMVHVFVSGNVSKRKLTTQGVYTLFPVFELSVYSCILHEMYLWNIFIYLVTFYYGMCKVPWYSYGMETCTCHKSVRNGICSIEHLLYEAVPYFEKVITMFSEWTPIGWKRTLLTSQAHLRSGNLPFFLVSKDANFSSYPCFNRYFQETGLQYMDFNELYICK